MYAIIEPSNLTSDPSLRTFVEALVATTPGADIKAVHLTTEISYLNGRGWVSRALAVVLECVAWEHRQSSDIRFAPPPPRKVEVLKAFPLPAAYECSLVGSHWLTGRSVSWSLKGFHPALAYCEPEWDL